MNSIIFSGNYFEEKKPCIALIADEFTTYDLAPDADILPLTPLIGVGNYACLNLIFCLLNLLGEDIGIAGKVK